MADQVTARGVSLLLSDSPATPVVLQVLDVKSIANGRYTCMLSDGSMKAKAMLPTHMSAEVEAGKIQHLGLIRVLSHATSVIPNLPNKALIVTDCEVVSGALDREVGSESSSSAQKTQCDEKPKFLSAPVKSAAQIVQEEHGRAAPAARMGVSRRVYPLVSLTPYQGSWTIKVRVTSKGPLRTYRNARGEGSVFNVELTDEDGTQIQATMFKEAAEKFYPMFELGKVYYVSNGNLRMANRRFSAVKNDYEMTLNASSGVEEVTEPDGKPGVIPLVKYNFVKIEDLAAYVNKRELFDAIGIVQSVSSTMSVRRKVDNTEFAKREIVLVDQSQKTVAVSLWSSLAVEDGAKLLEMLPDAPVVVIRSVRANDFQGVSLSTSPNSMVWINPDIPEARELRSWYDESGKDATLTSVGAGLSQRAGPTNDNRADISDITAPSVGEGKAAYFTVRACISYIKPDQTMWYTACSTCNRKVSEDSSRFWCEACQRHFDTASRRYIMLAKLTDHSGDAWVSFFNDQAEQILGVSADELATIKSQDDDQRQYSSQLSKVVWSSYVFRVSVAQTEYLGEKRQRITIRAVNDTDWASESRLLLAKMKLESS
ncbi:replication protein A 70 kDa DNA-binding subunit D [Selaginella moellendorffii]|uniref:replication protein A 70 kDa DNA-binding subunit D n=1 Tax=Selaginella moellendorffii TaxID=88036 RepID=UPI000D1C265D|nr:replication protein A 70 kDa DNA-binding subunit D [Selaginella moellendorffii]|eukprot:XP_024524116.1 replication protein A 70 kDa DNA-binding subunit D [Selaginella moellendorffii]